MLIVVATLALMFAAQTRLGMYLVEETLTVLLSIAVVLIPLLLIVIAILLLWQGASLGFLWLKGIVDRITSIRNHPMRPDRAMSQLFPRH